MNDLYKTTARNPGRSLLLLGMFLAVAGYVLMMLLMFAAKILITPWYAPLLGTLGVALIILALMRSRSIWRWSAAVLFSLFAAAQWLSLFAIVFPDCTGLVKDG